MKYNVTSGVLLISDISDHLPVVAVCDYTILIRGSSCYQSKGVVNDGVIENLKLELNQPTWQNVLEQSDVNIALT